jgi:hypothetical protein
MRRRAFLESAIAAAAGAKLLGCGGGGSDSNSAASPALAGPVVWDPSPLLFMAESFASIDLAQTLPIGVRRGGVFSLAAASRPLPAQLSLSPDGLLRATGASVSSTANIVFAYQEPA